MGNRREVISSILGFAAVGLTAHVAEAQHSGAMPGMGGMAMTMQQCVDSCLKSHAVCLETARYCTEQAGQHVAPAHLALLLDCAEMCQTTANSMLRLSPLHAVLCGACAQLCEACAQDCLAFHADAQMERCAGTCRDCAQSCREMAKMPR